MIDPLNFCLTQIVMYIHAEVNSHVDIGFRHGQGQVIDSFVLFEHLILEVIVRLP